jgi:hypothetical protein
MSAVVYATSGKIESDGEFDLLNFGHRTSSRLRVTTHRDPSGRLGMDRRDGQNDPPAEIVLGARRRSASYSPQQKPWIRGFLRNYDGFLMTI